MKVLRIVMNTVVVSLAGIVCGLLTTGLLLYLSFVSEKYSDLLMDSWLGADGRDFDVYLLVYGPSIVYITLFNYLEHNILKWKVVHYFRGNVFRKLVLYAGTTFLAVALLLSWGLIHEYRYGMYDDYATELVHALEKTALNGEQNLTIDNRYGVDSILFLPGYGVPKEALLKTGIVDANIVDTIADRNRFNEGITLYLVKENKVVAAERFVRDVYFDVEGGFQIASVQNGVVTIHITKKSQKGYDTYIIDKVE